MNRLARFFLFPVLTFSAACLHAETTVSIVADSTLRPVLPELTQMWADGQEDMKVDLQFMNAATLNDLVAKGKAGDVIIFADAADAKAAEKKALIVDDGKKTVARNELVVFGRKALLKDEELDWYDLIGRGEWDSFALGDPAKTSSGKAAQAAMVKHDLAARLKSDGAHLSGDEKAALNWVRRGEADAAIVMRTDAANAKVEGFEIFPIEAADYPPIYYIAAPGKNTRALPAARGYVQFLVSKEAREVWKKAGYLAE